MEKKRSVAVKIFEIALLFLWLLIIPNPNLYSQEAPPFEVVLKSNLKIRSEMEDKIKNILEGHGFDIASAKITVEESEHEERPYTYLRAVANIEVIILEKDTDKVTQYFNDIKEAIHKEIPGFVNYRISFTFESLTSPSPEIEEQSKQPRIP